MTIKATKKPTAFGDIYRYPFTRSYHGRRNDILTFNAASTKFTSRYSSNEIRRSAEIRSRPPATNNRITSEKVSYFADRNKYIYVA